MPIASVSGAGVHWHLTDAAGTDTATYMDIQGCHASGGATFNALTADGNVDGGDNTGWDFGAAVIKLLVSGAWKTVAASKIMVGGAWKAVAATKKMVSGAWKS
jgi:hypothetical protein